MSFPACLVDCSNVTESASMMWPITNLHPDQLITNCIWSPRFCPAGKGGEIEFQLALLPRPMIDNCQSDVSVYLWHSSNAEQLCLEYEVSIVSERSLTTLYTQKYHWDYNANVDHSFNVRKFISFTLLMDRKNKFFDLDNNRLTIQCTVNMRDPQIAKIPHLVSSSSFDIIQDYQTLLDSGKYSDFTLVVGEAATEIPVHKSILATRSEVFAAMFKHDSKEAQEGRVVIPDFSVEVFHQVLRYIYTGFMPSIGENTPELFIAADKYQLEPLRTISEQYLISNLTTKSVVNMLLLSDMYNAVQLKRQCIKYITKYSVEVRKTDGWTTMLKQRPDFLLVLYQDMSDKAKPLFDRFMEI